jgi:hypothetical protein
MPQLESEIYYIGDGRRSGINLTHPEIELLYLVYRHQFMTFNQIYEYISVRQQRTYNSMRTRLNLKFVKYRLLNHYEYSLGQSGFRYYYYRIGKRGLEVLVEFNYITDEEATHYMNNQRPIKNIDHFLATQEVVIRLISRAKKEGLILESDNTSCTVDVQEKLVEFFPDWTIRNKDTVVYIELDTGHEKLNQIKEKMKRYSALAMQKPMLKHIVVFIALDDSFLTRFSYGTKETRIANMKSVLLHQDDFHHSNLNTYVVPLRHSHELVYRLITHEEQDTKDVVELHIEGTLVVLNEFNKTFPYSVEMLPKQLPILSQDDRYFVFPCRFRSERTSREDVLLLVGLEAGNINMLDRLVYYAERANNGSLGFPVHAVIGVYFSTEGFEQDLLPKLPSNVYLLDAQETGKEFHRQPIFYSVKGASGREAVSYDSVVGID